MVYINNKLRSLFEGNLDLSYEHYGNIFKCEVLKDQNKNCGNEVACKSCKLKNTLEEVLREKHVIKNIQMKQVFSVNDKNIMKWFDISMVPFDYKGNPYVWVAMIDLTDVMKYKVEADRLHMLNDDDNAIEKDRFHENVMNCISTNCQTDDQAFFILTELKDIVWLQESFGFLWKNEHLASFYEHMIDLLGPKDYACRYSDNQYLIFLPCVVFEEVEKFIKLLDQHNDIHFQLKEVLVHKIMRMKVDKESAKKLVDKDQLYIKYFKAIGILENHSGEGTCEMVF